MPLLRETGPCFPITKDASGLPQLLLAGGSLFFDLVATAMCMVKCFCLWKAGAAVNSTDGFDVVGLIWKESVMTWLAMCVLHTVNM